MAGRSKKKLVRGEKKEGFVYRGIYTVNMRKKRGTYGMKNREAAQGRSYVHCREKDRPFPKGGRRGPPRLSWGKGRCCTGHTKKGKW